MVICLDMVGRESGTIGRADDDEWLSKEGIPLVRSNTIASSSLQKQK